MNRPHLTPHPPRGLRRLRLLQGITQEQLAAQVGCSQGLISQVERGFASLTPELRERVYGVLQIDTEEVPMLDAC